MAYEDRKGRLEVHSAKLNNTDGNARNDYFKIQTANLFLRRFGVQLIANDPYVPHLRGMARHGSPPDKGLGL